MSDKNFPEYDLARYATSLCYDDIPRMATEHVTHLIFDNIGISIGAYVQGHKSGLITEKHCLSIYGELGGSTLWSGQGALPADMAALCNGTWAEILDYQDVVVDPRNNGHLGVTIVPAAIAVAQRERASGAELITAIIAGIEVALSTLRAVGRNHRSDGRGFRTTSIAGPLGAAVACGKLLKLNISEMLSAMGIAGACSPNGLMPSLAPSNGSFGMDKDWVSGQAAQLAVNAADLAKSGLTGSDRVITGEFGIVASHAHGDGNELIVPEGGAPGIGAIALKKFASCYGVHSAMEATINLVEENKLLTSEITKVCVRVKADSAVTLSGRTITNHMAARFSLAYAVASAAVRSTKISADDFEEPAIFDPSVKKLMERVEIIADEELTQFHKKNGGFPAHVTISSNNVTYDKRIDHPIGSMQRPMSQEELEEKFSDLTKQHFSQDQLTAILKCSRDIENLKDINQFIDLL